MALFALLVAVHVGWFHSPSGNIRCEVGVTAYCQTFRPPDGDAAGERSVGRLHAPGPPGRKRPGERHRTGRGFTIARQGVSTF